MIVKINIPPPWIASNSHKKDIFDLDGNKKSPDHHHPRHAPEYHGCHHPLGGAHPFHSISRDLAKIMNEMYIHSIPTAVHCPAASVIIIMATGPLLAWCD